MRDKISLCVITHNEPKRLERCLSLFKPAVDEIVVVHATGAAERNPEIRNTVLRHRGVYGIYENTNETAISEKWEHVDDFAAARQKSFDLACNDWCLWVDADDVPSDNFAEALHELLEQHGSKFDGFVLYHNVAGRGIAHNKRERLVKRSAGRWQNSIHENFVPHGGDGSRYAHCDQPVIIHLPDDEPKQGSERNLRILQSIPEDKRTTSVLYHLSGEYQGMGDKAKAVQFALEAIKRPDCAAPERYELYMNIAELARPQTLQTDQPEYNQMVTALHAAYRTQPNRREALALLGAMHLDLGDLITAEAYIRCMMALPRPADKPWTHRDGLYGWAGEAIWTQFLRMAGQTEKADAIEKKRISLHDVSISVCHPTRGRALQAAQTRKRWLDAAANPERIEYIFGFSEDDEESVGILSRFRHATSPAGNLAQTGGTAVQNYNAATNAATGKIIVTAQDDVFPPLHWDLMLEQALADKLEKPAILQIKDGYRNDDLMVTFCVTRPTFAALGYGSQNILAPEYHGVFSDTEFSLRARRQPFFVPSDIVFKHEHPFWNPAVPTDDTYKMENSDEAYKFGNEVFRRRNPDLMPSADTALSA